MEQTLYPIGSYVKHINKPGKMWVVIKTCSPQAHQIKSFPDKDGNYELTNGDYKNLLLIDDNSINSFNPQRQGSYIIKK
jgi:hypothetical protein